MTLNELNYTAFFKLLSKVIKWLRLLRFVIGLTIAPVFQPMRQLHLAIVRAISRTLSKLQVIAWNSDKFITLFAPVVIGQSHDFAIGFSTVI